MQKSKWQTQVEVRLYVCVVWNVQGMETLSVTNVFCLIIVIRLHAESTTHHSCPPPASPSVSSSSYTVPHKDSQLSWLLFSKAIHWHFFFQQKSRVLWDKYFTETTVITTTCGIIYSCQYEWLMWKVAGQLIRLRAIGQFLCDFKQCPQCPWRVTDIWIAGTAASSLCWLPFSAGFSPQQSHSQRLQIFHLQPRKKKQGPFQFQQLGGCEWWQPSGWRHWWLLRQPEDRWDSWGLVRSPGLLVIFAPFN